MDGPLSVGSNGDGQKRAKATEFSYILQREVRMVGRERNYLSFYLRITHDRTHGKRNRIFVGSHI